MKIHLLFINVISVSENGEYDNNRDKLEEIVRQSICGASAK